MDIVRKFGGRTYGGADLFRKGIGKKDKELVRKEAEKLYDEIKQNGYSEHVAKYISDDLSDKGGYSFCLAHAVEYAFLCLQTAYLKSHYPVYFFKALLNNNINDYGALNKYIIDAKKFGVEILVPNINLSERNFIVVDNKILFGLEAIKGIGEKFVDVILNERNNGKFLTFEDFKNRVSPSNTQIISLVKSGAIPCKDKKTFLLKYNHSTYENREYKDVCSLPKLSELKDKWNIDTDIIKDKEVRLKLYNDKKRIEFTNNQK